MRVRLPWLVALPCMAVGSVAAHAAGALVPAVRSERDVEHGHIGSTIAPVLGLVLALFLVVLLGRLTRRRAAGAALFFLLPPLAWVFQEGAERVLASESMPFTGALEPSLLLGLLLQLPFGLAAYAVARLVFAAARRIFAVRRAQPPAAAPTLERAARPSDLTPLRRLGALVDGRSSRGPPLLVG